MRTALALIVFAAVFTATAASAADLNVYTGGSMAAPLKTIGADFTRSTGHSLGFVSGTTGTMLKRIRDGEKADVIVISAEGVEALLKEGRIAPGSTRPVANSLLGVGVRAGAPKPDISTTGTFKAAMLHAKSVSFPDPKLGATTGIYLLQLFARLGIADQMQAKTIVKPVGAEAAAAVASGEAEVVVTFISEMIPDKGVSIVGTLPEAILNPSPYVAGVSATAGDPAAARDFVAFVTSAAEQPILKAGGLAPAPDR